MTKPVLLRFSFDFIKLPLAIGGRRLSSSRIDCNGYKWQTAITHATDGGHLGVHLMNINEQTLNVNYSISIDTGRRNVAYWQSRNSEGGCLVTIRANMGNGFLGSMKYADVVGGADGDLRVSVVIQLQEEQDKLYSPPNTHSEKMLHFLQSEDDADLLFDVEGTQVLAHSQIIKAIAPILASCGTITNRNDNTGLKTTGDTLNANVIDGISPESLKIILAYIYTGCYPDPVESTKYGRELINAANKYELIELKMAMENILVGERVITRSNVSDYILFADSQSCPLLEEYTVSLFKLWSEDLIKIDCSKQLRESGNLLHEALFLHPNENVSDLRRELGKRNLDTDGSKEVLEARLKKAKEEETIILE